MKLVKLRLADSPFWFLGNNISLTRQNPTSDFLNIDALQHEEVQIINMAIRKGEIKVFDPENIRLNTVEAAKVISGELSVDINDIEDDESDSMPEVFSVTIDENIEDETKESGPEAEDYREAEIILSKNGNTVKKIIKNIPNTTEGLVLLHASLEVEKQNKNRIGIVSAIEQRIMEF